MKREFLMLASSTVRDTGQTWWASEKLDGMRAWYDGQGGLWSRYNRKIWAPSWWLARLPDVCLDGELWLGRGRFNDVMSVCRSHNGDWTDVEYRVYDTPSRLQVYQAGHVKNATLDEVFVGQGIDKSFGRRYSDRYAEIPARFAHPQTPMKYADAVAWADQIISEGGEGVIWRDPLALWTPKRVFSMVKLKGAFDMEGVVVGVDPGIGRLTGMMGSLSLRLPSGVVFSLGTGFTDQDRVWFWTERDSVIGRQVTFKYRELTPAGVPREARYWRLHA